MEVNGIKKLLFILFNTFFLFIIVKCQITLTSQNSNKTNLTKKNDPKTTIENVKINNVMIFLDDSEDEEGGAIVGNFTLALCNGYYPIIASNNVFYNFLNSTNESIKTNANTNWKDNWTIYKTTDQDYYLFISNKFSNDKEKLYEPKKQEVQKKFNIEDEDYKEFLNGFRLSKLEKVDNFSIPLIKKINIENLKEIFVKTQEEIFGKWNIFLNGHGFYSKELLKLVESGILPTQLKTLSEDQFADALIAGIKLNDFRNLIQFLINDIRTNFLLYSTCFSGGYNLDLAFINTLLNEQGIIISSEKQKKPKFVIAAGATLDVATPSTTFINLEKCTGCKIKKKSQCDINIEKINLMDFTQFFDTLNKFSQDSIMSTKFKDEELKDILSKILPRPKFKIDIAQDPFGISIMPQIKYPNVDDFFIVDLGNELSIINNVLLIKSKLEKSNINVNNKEAIVIYPANVEIPINVNGKKLPIILSLIPSINLQKIKILNILNYNISDYFNRTTLKFAFPKYFFIENYNAKDGAYKNVLIMYKSENIYALYTDVNNTIHLFNKNGTAVLPNKFKNISDNTLINSLLNYFVMVNEPFKEETSKIFNFELLKKLLNNDEIKEFDEKIKNLDKSIKNSELNEKLKIFENDINAKIEEHGIDNYLEGIEKYILDQYEKTKDDKYKLFLTNFILIKYFKNKKVFIPLSENIKKSLSKDIRNELNEIEENIKNNIKTEGINNYLQKIKMQVINEFIETKTEEYNIFSLIIILLEFFSNNETFKDIKKNKKISDEIYEFIENVKNKIKDEGIKKYIKELELYSIKENVSEEKDEFTLFNTFLFLLKRIFIN